MVILVVIAVLWLWLRLAAVLRMMAEEEDQPPQTPSCPMDVVVQDAPPPGSDAARSGPQDAPFGPQDAAPAQWNPLTGNTVVSSSQGNDPTSAVTAAVWRDLARAVQHLAAGPLLLAEVLREDVASVPTGDPPGDWLVALRETISDTVPRPDAGPPCLGGRDDAAYLRGWDDAVDWISQGRDAEAPTWAGVGYMTGWHDAVRRIDSARRSARAWPTPTTGSRTSPSSGPSRPVHRQTGISGW